MLNAVVDVETTGLHKAVHEVIKIAVVVFDKDLNPTKNICRMAKPYNFEVIEEEALGINGIKLEDLKSSPTGISVRSEILKWRKDVLGSEMIHPYGWNYKSFDRDFLIKWFGEDNYFKIFDYHATDIDEWLLFCSKELNLFPEIKSSSLPKTCDDLGIPINAHDPLGDCRATLDVYKEIRKRIKNLKRRD